MTAEPAKRPAARRPGRGETLARVAERVAAGEDFRMAVAEFLDDLKFAAHVDEVRRRVQDEPPRVDAHVDAYLAALAEDVAMRNEFRAPAWALAPQRFLDHFWWPSKIVAFRARMMVESPPSFRRRGIFIGGNTLHRV